MVIGARSSILATIITFVFVPLVGKDGEVEGGKLVSTTRHSLRCTPGKRIPATPLAKRLGVNGRMCAKRIERVIVKPVRNGD